MSERERIIRKSIERLNPPSHREMLRRIGIKPDFYCPGADRPMPIPRHSRGV